MRIYLKSGAEEHLILVTPGVDSDASDFKNADGSNRQFTVRFTSGTATVPSGLGQYLVDKGLVQKTPPAIKAMLRPQLIVPEERVRTHRILGGTSR
jgi:hypothetical protein